MAGFQKLILSVALQGRLFPPVFKLSILHKHAASLKVIRSCKLTAVQKNVFAIYKVNQ